MCLLNDDTYIYNVLYIANNHPKGVLIIIKLLFGLKYYCIYDNNGIGLKIQNSHLCHIQPIYCKVWRNAILC